MGRRAFTDLGRLAARGAAGALRPFRRNKRVQQWLTQLRRLVRRSGDDWYNRMSSHEGAMHAKYPFAAQRPKYLNKLEIYPEVADAADEVMDRYGFYTALAGIPTLGAGAAALLGGKEKEKAAMNAYEMGKLAALATLKKQAGSMGLGRVARRLSALFKNRNITGAKQLYGKAQNRIVARTPGWQKPKWLSEMFPGYPLPGGDKLMKTPDTSRRIKMLDRLSGLNPNAE